MLNMTDFSIYKKYTFICLFQETEIKLSVIENSGDVEHLVA